MNGVSRKVHTPRIDASRGTQKRVENRTVNAHTCMRRLHLYICIHIECPKTVAMFLSTSFLSNLGLSVIKM